MTEPGGCAKNKGYTGQWVQPLRWALASLLLVYALYIVIGDNQTIQAVRQIPLWLAPLLIFVVISYEAMASIRLFIIGRLANVKNITPFQWYRLHLVGQLGNLLLPQAGNIYRALTLKRSHAVPYSRFLEMTILKIWIELTLALCIIFLIFSIYQKSLPNDYKLVIGILGLLVVIVVSLPFISKTTSSALLNIPLQRHVKSFWIRAYSSSEFLTIAVTKKSFLLHISIVTTAMLALSAFAQFLGFSALGVETSARELSILVILLRISNYVILTPGNLGVREIAYAISANAMGINMADAILVSMMIRGASYLNILTLGLLFGWREILTKKTKS